MNNNGSRNVNRDRKVSFVKGDYAWTDSRQKIRNNASYAKKHDPLGTPTYEDPAQRIYDKVKETVGAVRQKKRSCVGTNKRRGR